MLAILTSDVRPIKNVFAPLTRLESISRRVRAERRAGIYARVSTGEQCCENQLLELLRLPHSYRHLSPLAAEANLTAAEIVTALQQVNPPIIVTVRTIERDFIASRADTRRYLTAANFDAGFEVGAALMPGPPDLQSGIHPFRPVLSLFQSIHRIPNSPCFSASMVFKSVPRLSTLVDGAVDPMWTLSARPD